jgi:recombination protein RecT
MNERKSIGQFLAVPATQNFLEDNLKERKGEFVSNLLALTDSNKALKDCDPRELMMCAMNATALNLPLNNNLGYAYVIPYAGKPTFQIGYKGLVQMAIRTGMYQTLNAVEIRKGEVKRNKITGEIEYIGDFPDNEIVGYLAYLKLQSGFTASIYMTQQQIEDHAARYSQVYQKDLKNKTRRSKWSEPEERPKMAKKTVLKQLLSTYGVMTSDMQQAFTIDNDRAEQQSNYRNDYQEADIVQQEDPAPIEQGEPEAQPQPEPGSNEPIQMKL